MNKVLKELENICKNENLNFNNELRTIMNNKKLNYNDLRIYIQDYINKYNKKRSKIIMEFESNESIRGNRSKYLSLITYCPQCGCYGLKRYDLSKEKIYKNEAEDRYEYICEDCERGEE